jgi:hypothetical protein
MFDTFLLSDKKNKGGFMAENQMEAAMAGVPCPKCGALVAKDALACPGCGAQAVKTDPKKAALTLGQKIAAITLIVNGIFLIAELFIMKSSAVSSTIRSALINIGIGAWLFTGQTAAVKWAKVGVILGGVLLPIIYIFAQHDYFLAVIQFFFSLALVGLLFGKAGKVRIGLAVPVILIFFGLEVFGLYSEIKGGNSEPPAAEQQAKAK